MVDLEGGCVKRGKSEEASRSRRRGRALNRFGRFGVAPLVVLLVASAAVACGSVASEPFDFGESRLDASLLADVAVSSHEAGPEASTPHDAASTPLDAANDGSTPLAACPTDYANLVTFLSNTTCGQCAGSQCIPLTKSCFEDCTCIAGALDVFHCAAISSSLNQCTALAVQIPSQYQTDTFVCAMTCEDTCVSTDVPDTGTSDPITDSGADADAHGG